MTLGQRLATTLKRAGLSPRHLGGATKIHFVTIYRTINGDGNRQPIHEQVLTNALDKLDVLLERGDLPFRENLQRKEKTERLKNLLDNHS